MKAICALLSLSTFFVGSTLHSQEPKQQPLIIADAASPGSTDQIRSFYPVTLGLPIIDSSGQIQRLFQNADIKVGQLNTDKYKLILSSSPDSNTPFIVDDAIFVNGQKLAGYSVWHVDPRGHLGENPSVCYEGTPAADVTGLIRRDGHVLIQCMDLGGGTFCSSALYLRVVPK
jgi:hypothetical protein